VQPVIGLSVHGLDFVSVKDFVSFGSFHQVHTVVQLTNDGTSLTVGGLKFGGSPLKAFGTVETDLVPQTKGFRADTLVIPSSC